jgi:hypothetical protein
MNNIWKVLLAVSIPVAVYAMVKKNKDNKDLKEKENIDSELFI